MRQIIVGLALTFGLSLSSQAASIGLNFMEGAAADTLGATDLAGAPGYAQVNWNNSGARWSNTAEMNDDTGAPSGVLAAWDCNNTWSTSAATDTPNGRLMHRYLDATGVARDDTAPYSLWNRANQPQVRLTGLSSWMVTGGASSYEVIVYFDGDETQGRVAEYWIQEATYSGDIANLTLGPEVSPHLFGSDVENFTGTFTQVPLTADSLANAQPGNYAVFTGLTSDSILVRSEEASSPGALRATINGIQIVAVPEPSTIALLVLGGIGVGLRLRRRS